MSSQNVKSDPGYGIYFARERQSPKALSVQHNFQIHHPAGLTGDLFTSEAHNKMWPTHVSRIPKQASDAYIA